MVFVQHLMAQKRRKSASRDLAIQMATIRTLLNECDLVASSNPMPLPLHGAFAEAPPKCTLFDPDELITRFEWAQGLTGDSKAVVLKQLHLAEALGPQRKLAKAPPLDVIDAMQRDFPHCSPILDVVRRRIALASCSLSNALALPPMLLNGPPGTGKTALAQRLAKALSAPFHRVDMASAGTTFAFVGLDVGYSSGRPGLIWGALQHECMTPVFLLDEIDKAGHGTDHNRLDAFLLSLLEPVTATRFRDAAIGLSLDASRITWLATCNNAASLHPALLSRFTVLDVGYPTTQQMPAIIASIHNELMASADWAVAFESTIAAPIVAALSHRPPRAVRRALEDAYANAAANGRRYLVAEDVPPKEQVLRDRPIGFTN